MKAFWLSLGLAFWAEMGDKSQFIALAFATRHTLRDVIVGIVWSTAAILLISVGLGSLIGAWVPGGYLTALSALCFLAFAIWTLRGDEEPGPLRESAQHPILFIGITFFLSELGDKTMLTAATLATTNGWFPVWIGTTIGMVCSDLLAVWFGRSLGKKIPEKTVKWMSAALFFIFALWYGIRAINAFR